MSAVVQRQDSFALVGREWMFLAADDLDSGLDSSQAQRGCCGRGRAQGFWSEVQ